MGKYLEQKKYQGVERASWSIPGSSHYISLVRGKANIVQVFDTLAGEVESSFDLSEQIENPIKGLHTLCEGTNTLAGSRHIVVDEKANSFTVDNETGECEELFKLKGQHVARTYMLHS